MQTGPVSFPHIQFGLGMLLLAAVVFGAHRWWSPPDPVHRYRRRDNILYTGRKGVFILVPFILGALTALATALLGGNPIGVLDPSSPPIRYGTFLGTIAPIALYGVVLAFLFPILAHRMHDYSSQAKHLVLHVSRFFTAQFYVLLIGMFVLSVHVRVALGAQFASILPSWMQSYNLVDAMAFIVLLIVCLATIHSVIKRVVSQLNTVDLVGRATEELLRLIAFNTDPAYRPVPIKIGSTRSIDQRTFLPGYLFENLDQVRLALLVTDIGAVTRHNAVRADLWATRKGAASLDAVLADVQDRREALRRCGGIELRHPPDQPPHGPPATTLTLPHGYDPARDFLIEHIVSELDQVVTLATSGGMTHILFDVLATYERRLIGAIERHRSPHDVDWCFFAFQRLRRFFYLQMTARNPWMARQALDMLNSVAVSVVRRWESTGYSVATPDAQFYDCCLSECISSLRKFSSMAVINQELSVLRAAVGYALQLLSQLNQSGHPNATRAVGSITRMLMSGAMFALERSSGGSTEVLLDALVRAGRSGTTHVGQELEDVFCAYCVSPNGDLGKVQTYPPRAIIESQLTRPYNPKLDLDREDLLVNRDSLASCAVAVASLVVTYASVTGREDRERAEALRKVLEATLRRDSTLVGEVRAWARRAAALGTPLLGETAVRVQEWIEAEFGGRVDPRTEQPERLAREAVRVENVSAAGSTASVERMLRALRVELKRAGLPKPIRKRAVRAIRRHLAGRAADRNGAADGA